MPARGKIDFSHLICCWPTVERTPPYARGDRAFVAWYGSRRPWRIGGPPPCPWERRAASPPHLLLPFSSFSYLNLPRSSPRTLAAAANFLQILVDFGDLFHRQLLVRDRLDLLYITGPYGDPDIDPNGQWQRRGDHDGLDGGATTAKIGAWLRR
jgi:hypothetical protein